ncbi:hypothetical protein EV368DRAFT_70380 [Lentinula lateritia]|nr:hypothetical protein EV368DRAFT_70380 [Lentinula lateritia]
MAAHDSILKAQVKQTRAANRKRRFDPFKEEDLVFVSTRNLTFEKGLAQKLIPKYIGQLDTQLHESLVAQPQWRIEKILSHTGSRRHAQWSMGDITWMPFAEISQLPCLPEYLELLGLKTIDQLPKGTGTVPEESHSKFARVAKNDDGNKIIFSTQQKHIGYTPIGYHSFASEFNKEDLPYKFAYWDHANFHEPIITNLNTQSPPMSIFGIEEWECFAPNKAIRPGYEEVLSTEYQELCNMALDQARGATRGRRKAEIRKQEKKNAAAAAKHKKTGTLHFHSGPKNASSSSRS